MTYEELEIKTQKAGLINKFANFLRSLIPARRSQKSTKGKWKLAFVVGHNKKTQGAEHKNLLIPTEWRWNKAIGQAMVKIANIDPEIEVKVFYRKPLGSYSSEINECYKHVNKWNPHLVYEGHFDWQSGAGIVKMLYAHFSSKAKLAAEIVLSNTALLMKEGDTNLTPTYNGQNGFNSLVGAVAPTVLLEPFDCTHAGHRARVNELTVYDFATNYIVSAKETLVKLYPNVVETNEVKPLKAEHQTVKEEQPLMKKMDSKENDRPEIVKESVDVSKEFKDSMKTLASEFDEILKIEAELKFKLQRKRELLMGLHEMVDKVGNK